MAKNQLDGSFSGLWSCELCGYSGFLCRCEHFNRGTGAWGRDKTLTGAEIAAEYWKSAYQYYRTLSDEAFEQSETFRRMVEHADIE